MRLQQSGRRIVSEVCVAGFLFAFAVLASQPAAAQASQDSISVETSQQLFAVMCALDAAGFDANTRIPAMYPADEQLRERLLALHGPAATAMRHFYAQHQYLDPDETLSPFLTFALVVGPPPDFNFIVSHDQLPPSVTSLEDFQTILRAFYAEAHLDREWESVQAETAGEASRLTPVLRQVVLHATGYLRELLNPTSVHTFVIFAEPLVGNRVNFRNVGNHYAVIVGPGPVVPLEDIQHSFLHYLLDPVVLTNQKIVSTRRALLDLANRAPLLPPVYQSDFLGLFDECLVRAVELRMTRPSAEKAEAALRDNDRTGFILVRPIYQQLIEFEKADPSMSFYFPQLVRGISIAEEQKRLTNFQFATAEEKTAASDLHGEEGGEKLDPLEQELARGDQQIAMQDGAGAAATFEAILKKHPNLPRALYGLALASVLQRDGEKAENLFEEVVHPSLAKGSAANTPAATPDILAWSHIYLGRIHDLQGDRDLAVTEYKAALSVSGIPDSARAAAQNGLNAPYRPATAPKGRQQ